MAELCVKLVFNQSGWKEEMQLAMDGFELGKGSQNASYLKAFNFATTHWCGLALRRIQKVLRVGYILLAYLSSGTLSLCPLRNCPFGFECTAV